MTSLSTNSPSSFSPFPFLQFPLATPSPSQFASPFSAGSRHVSLLQWTSALAGEEMLPPFCEGADPME